MLFKNSWLGQEVLIERILEGCCSTGLPGYASDSCRGFRNIFRRWPCKSRQGVCVFYYNTQGSEQEEIDKLYTHEIMNSGGMKIMILSSGWLFPNRFSLPVAQ